MNEIIQGDCLEKMKDMKDNSIDTIITDPPYGLSFMGKKWDYDVPSVEIWKECLRVLKPGGTALIFAGSRTQHRMAVNIEDAGFILKDCIMWLYGSGFPKATDISKQLDKRGGNNNLADIVGKELKRARIKRKISLKKADEMFCGGTTNYNWYEGRSDGIRLPSVTDFKKITEEWEELKPYAKKVIEVERETIGKQKRPEGRQFAEGKSGFAKGEVDITKAQTPEAKLWNGWKSHGLKPAYEPIIVAMKPNEGTYVNNALKWGVSGLNIDEGRIGTEITKTCIKDFSEVHGNKWGKAGAKYPTKGFKDNPPGRFPANIILDEEAAKMLDEQSGQLSQCGGEKKTTHKDGMFGIGTPGRIFKEKDRGASRFFYVAKASKAERNLGIDVGEEKNRRPIGEVFGDGNAITSQSTSNANNHPTVKPIKLMEYLCLLTKTPTSGIVLDPFSGSFSTGVACINTGRDFIGIEKDPEYCKIGRARIKGQLKLLL